MVELHSFSLTILTAVLGIVAMAALWLAVQLAWGHEFPGDELEPDVLARRGGCTDCRNPEACPRRRAREEGAS
ncbi:MAG: hypothetical protein GY733_04280 [bacterium]|nr:hypothetical protein [bacterium]